MPVLETQQLNDFANALLLKGGAGDHAADVVADSLVQANLRGHDSHGVMRIPSYLASVQQGRLHPEARLRVESESANSLVCSGGWGFGQVVTRELMQRLIEKAENAAIACATLREAAHIGRLGEYAETAAERGLASLICANTHGAAQRVAPIGGKRPRLGTNPLCIGMPGAKEGPFIFDIGTSATAEGKVRVKKIAGASVPPGWILDPEGRPTTDPNQLYGDPPGSILPMGGDQAYKGFGLAFMIEMLCGALSGGACSYPNPPPPMGNCAFFIAINPAHLAGMPHLQREVSQLETYVRETPRIEGAGEITLPGDPERRTLAERTRTGIPLDDGNWNALVALANELAVPVPSPG